MQWLGKTNEDTAVKSARRHKSSNCPLKAKIKKRAGSSVIGDDTRVHTAETDMEKEVQEV